MKFSKIATIGLSTALCVATVPPPFLSFAQDLSPEVVKATYILKLREFILLGTTQHHVDTICYYERPGVDFNESVGQIMEKYTNQQGIPLNSRKPATVKVFRAIQNFSECDIFYIPASEEANLAALLNKLNSTTALTMSSIPQFINKGGMVGFVTDETDHVKMEGNNRTITQKGIRIDAQILEIMQRVIQ